MQARVVAYVVSLTVLAVAVSIRWLLDPLMGDTLPLVTLFAAVAITVWRGGYLSALLVVLLGYAACAYLFIEPRGSLDLSEARNFTGLIAYLFTCSIIIGLGEATRRARRQVEFRGETLRVTLGSMGDAVITTDPEARITSLNAVAVSLTGWTQDAAAGQALESVFKIINEQTRQPAANPAMRALREGVIAGLANHTLLIRKDGRELPIDDSAAPIRDRDNRILGCVLIFRDITERQLLEQELEKRHQAARVLASIVESSQDAIISKSLDGIIHSWNAAAERLFGYRAEETIGKHITLIIPPNRLGEEEQIISRIRQGERVNHFDTVRLRKNGDTVDISLTISPVFDEAGRVIGASKIAREITDRKESEERIYGLMAELKESDRRKDEFLAMLSHELRGPLAPIANMLEIMNRAPGDQELVKQACETMERQLGQLVRLVDDLMDVSRITKDKIELRKERTELGVVIHQAVEVCTPLAERAQHEVKVTIPPEPIYVDGDPVRLVQIFSNLLSNACKYTKPGGIVSVTLERHGSDAVITVADTGVGISSDKLQSIFDTFAQVDRSLGFSQGGLGIGLTLVKRLVEMHDGVVKATSEGAGHGSQFRVHLPILLKTAVRSQPAIKPQTSMRPRRVLVVDDNVDAAISLVRLLRLAGHETSVAHDGLEAIRAAEQYGPDIILLDIGLPNIDGHTACRRIREHPWGKKIIIIALTGWSQDEDRFKSKEAGFDAHMVKPLNWDALMQLFGEEQPASV
jgi:PAS domain S-box-containing protein